MQNYCMPRKIQSHEDFSSLLLGLHLLLFRKDTKEYVFNNEGKATVIPGKYLYGLGCKINLSANPFIDRYK